MAGENAQGQSTLFCTLNVFFAGSQRRHFLAEILEFSIFGCNLFDQGVINRHGAKARTENCVVSCCINTQAIGQRNAIGILKIKLELHTLGTANPVLLHQPDFFRPIRQVIQCIQQVLRIGRDLQKPLGQFALFNQGIGTPTPAVNYLFIGQDGLVDRIPVDL